MAPSTSKPKATEPQDGLGEPIASPEGAKVDIVFVHGLGGTRTGTWTWKGKDEDDEDVLKFWPKDFLPKDCPTARILAFGYNGHFAHFYHLYGPKEISTELTIDDHSTSLFQKLSGLREQTKTPPNRPIIFVAHSLGGLVVANALSKNYRELVDEKSKNLSLRTIGTLFLGTPFGGSDAATYGNLALKVIKLVSKTQTDSMQNLVKRSEKLASINDAFTKMRNERDRTGAKPFIESIAANHVTMTKFESPAATGYKDVRDKLCEWIKGLDMSDDEKRKAGLGKVNNVTLSNIKNVGGNVAGVVEPGAYQKGANFVFGQTDMKMKDLFG